MSNFVSKALLFVLGLLVWAASPELQGQIRVQSGQECQQVFSGEAHRLTVTLHNPGAVPAEANLHVRLFQATTATAVLLTNAPWKRLQMLPGQTVLESASLPFPLVKAETRFLLQWTDSANHVLGRTEVLVYPPDLLQDLRPLASGESLGLFDPAKQLQPLLQAARLDFKDLEQSELETFEGKLVLLGPFASQGQMPSGLAGKIKALAEKGTAVVWMQPPPDKAEPPQPSFYTVQEGKGAVVVVQAALVTNLPESPQAQLNLLHCARLALRPEPPRLPHLTSQP